jgi:hypothetical protein
MNTSDLTHPTSDCAGEQDGFYADLADGLHAMAQPLTILRSAVAMLSFANEPEVPRHRCLDISVRQVERVCDLFASLQNLVASRLGLADAAPLDLRALLTQKVEDRVAQFRERGVELALVDANLLPPALGDARRTEEAISAVLEIALAVASQGERIEIRRTRASDFIEVVVGGGQGRRLNSGELLALSVAKANLLSQRGQYRFTAEPFCVTLALPAGEFALQGEQTSAATYAN